MTDHMPLATSGQTIGLLGGSFDPPHLGHLHISKEALRQFRLDRVWWLVSPGNPLKKDSPAGFQRRMEASRRLVDHPRIAVTDIEMRLNTRHTAETLARLTPRYPGIRFVWLMGADNLAGFHKWENWREIISRLPIGVLGRAQNGVRAGSSPAARAYANYRLPSCQSVMLPHRSPPCWCLVNGPTVDISSTEIRNSGEWVR
jgi:nicotinate-nucleotide adenylyltransferase